MLLRYKEHLRALTEEDAAYVRDYFHLDEDQDLFTALTPYCAADVTLALLRANRIQGVTCFCTITYCPPFMPREPEKKKPDAAPRVRAIRFPEETKGRRGRFMARVRMGMSMEDLQELDGYNRRIIRWAKRRNYLEIQ